jgi:gephyrin
MMNASLAVTPMAALSRPICGIRHSTLILTVPGSPKGACENVSAIMNVIPHAITLLLNDRKSSESFHQCMHSKHTVHHRKSPFPLETYQDALEMVLKRTRQLSVESIPLIDALDRTLATDVHSPCVIPPCRVSIVDGYAYCGITEPGDYELISGFEFAQGDLLPGQVVRINTGNPVPLNTNGIVMVEDTKVIRQDTEERCVRLLTLGKSYWREPGSDVMLNECLAEKGTVLDPSLIGLLASCKITHVQVSRIPIVGIFSTGNELVDINDPQTMTQGSVVDSNRISLLLLLKKMGVKTIDGGIVKDKPEALIATYKSLSKQADIVISSGGVSMGQHDYIKKIITEELKGTIHFGRVLLKPG